MSGITAGADLSAVIGFQSWRIRAVRLLARSMSKTVWHGTKYLIAWVAAPHFRIVQSTFDTPSSTPTKTRNQLPNSRHLAFLRYNDGRAWRYGPPDCSTVNRPSATSIITRSRVSSRSLIGITAIVCHSKRYDDRCSQ
jgi:hypothetical protein